MTYELPPHRSYSQLSTAQKCLRQYFLSKIAKVPETPAVYLVAGNAVHAAIERINLNAWEATQHASE